MKLPRRRFLHLAAGVAALPFVPRAAGVRAHPSLRPMTYPAFLASARPNPGKTRWAGAGTGNPPFLAGELFKGTDHLDRIRGPCRAGAPAVTDLLGGQVQIYFGSLPATIE